MCSSRPLIADATLRRLDPLIWELASVDEFEAQPSRTGAELIRAHKVSDLRPSHPLRLRACRASPPSLRSHARVPAQSMVLVPRYDAQITSCASAAHSATTALALCIRGAALRHGAVT